MSRASDASKFKQLTGINPGSIEDRLLAGMQRKFVIDVIAFDDCCIQHFGYDVDKHGSLADFVAAQFGQEMKTLTCKEYVKEGGGKCPACGGNQLEGGETRFYW